MLEWSNYVALGDSLTSAETTPGPVASGSAARRLAGIHSTRTAVSCALTNLATDGASVAAVIEWQLPSVARMRPDPVSVTKRVGAPYISRLTAPRSGSPTERLTSATGTLPG